MYVGPSFKSSGSCVSCWVVDKSLVHWLVSNSLWTTSELQFFHKNNIACICISKINFLWSLETVYLWLLIYALFAFSSIDCLWYRFPEKCMVHRFHDITQKLYQTKTISFKLAPHTLYLISLPLKTSAFYKPQHVTTFTSQTNHSRRTCT